MTTKSGTSEPWCIVVADDHGHERAPVGRASEESTPVQFARLGAGTTVLQSALCRATRIAPASQVMVTVMEEYRYFWEPSVWFVRPEHRFVCESRAESPLTVAAAVLKIAEESSSHVIVIAPGRVHVLRERVLAAALENAVSVLPSVAEGVLTLAMLDKEQGIDEDYLVLERPGGRSGLQVLGVARRPNTWVAHHLRQEGALIASGIMIGYAGAFAAHISRQWPGLTRTLNQAAKTATAASAECELSIRWNRHIPRNSLAALRWHAPTLKQRALCVEGCGWSGLRSARAVARTYDYLSMLANVRASIAPSSEIVAFPGGGSSPSRDGSSGFRVRF